MSDTNTPTGSNATKKFSHVAYAVIDRGDNKDSKWREIGIVFPHGDGKGFDILFDVVPLNGRITVRVQKERN